ncbi:MAG TPA: PD-(D/E)XK nuclease family protein, partial [Clostridia bacterium]|nr:PD-(D/E)XK nuclease family protein [Clostridia bacterium]
GMSWGRVVHRVLEVCAQEFTPDLGLLVESIVAEEGRHPEDKQEVLELVGGILESPFWQRVLESDRRFTEVPFSIKMDSEEFGLAGETVVSGIIDLVFKEDGGWVLVDYKTDTIGDDIMFRELVDYYGPQVQMYKEYWGDLTGEKVAEAGLYFTYNGNWVTV